MKDLETYLKECHAEGIIDFHIRTQITVSSDKDIITFYIHPQDRDGKTLDFAVSGNNLTDNSDHPSPPQKQEDYQLKQEFKYLCGGIQRHEAILGIQLDHSLALTDADLIRRARTCLDSYRERHNAMLRMFSEILENLNLISECEGKLRNSNWSNSTYSIIQVLITRICGLCAARLRRFSNQCQSTDNYEF